MKRAGLQQGAARGQLRQAREARRDGWSGRPARPPGRATGRTTPTTPRRPSARRRSCARRRRAGASRSPGTSAATTAATRASRPSRADLVVAFDADHATVDALYRRLREERREDVLPLVMSVTDPSPDLGWRGRERASLERRGTPELALCLARRAPRLHHRQRAGARAPRLAALARHHARDRVPRPRRPDGPAAARRQARRHQPRLRAARRSSARSRSASRSTAAEAVSETRTLYEARPRA